MGFTPIGTKHSHSYDIILGNAKTANMLIDLNDDTYLGAYLFWYLINCGGVCTEDWAERKRGLNQPEGEHPETQKRH